MHGGPNVHVLEFLLILGIGLIPQIVGYPRETAAFCGGFLEWGYPNSWISMVFMKNPNSWMIKKATISLETAANRQL
jgi:hypothetical protein